MPTRTVIVEFGDIVETFMAASANCADATYCPIAYNGSSSSLKATEWAGGKFSDTRRYITDGYYQSEMETAGNFNLTSPKRRRVWDEFDGDPDIDRLLQADDNPFRTTRRVKESREGLTINLEMAMNAGTYSTVLTAYGAWVARLIAGLEAHGHDLEVNITLSVGRGWEGDSDAQTTRVVIPVKRFGELSDFTRWSVMFSPTGFRHVGFTALIMAAGMNNKRVRYTYGFSQATGWDVTWDADEGTLGIMCSRTADRFPADKMSELLRATGISAE